MRERVYSGWMGLGQLNAVEWQCFNETAQKFEKLLHEITVNTDSNVHQQQLLHNSCGSVEQVPTSALYNSTLDDAILLGHCSPTAEVVSTV